MLAHTLGASVADLTEGLVAPSRTASKSQTLALVASQPGIDTPALAEDMELPAWYISELIRCLEATGEVARQPPGWRRVYREPSSVADSR
jgi:hypothetical protein